MAMQEQQLGQLRPANTSAASLYSPGSSETAIVYSIVVCNTSGADATYRIFHDDNGTTYDETTALFWDVTLTADSSDILEMKVSMDDSSGNLAVRTDTANAITFTAYGVVIT